MNLSKLSLKNYQKFHNLIHQKVEEQLNEINSHIDIAKSDIIDTIKETENEIASDIVRKSKEIKNDNITTRNLIREKTKKIDQKRIKTKR